MSSSTRSPGNQTDGVRLRDVTEADLPVLFEQQMDPEANRMAAFPARNREAFAAHWRQVLDDGAVLKKTILFDGRVAENILSFEQLGRTLVGYWVGKEYWGKGIATRALSEFLNHVTARPLYARVAKHNRASIRVLEKCGFRICGEDRGPFGPDGEEVEEFILELSAGEGDGDGGL